MVDSITDLIVPEVGDDLDAARTLCKIICEELGPETPIQFLRFHPYYKMMEFGPTPVEMLEKHYAVAKKEGLRYAYIGNVPGHPLEHTYCPECIAFILFINEYPPNIPNPIVEEAKITISMTQE